VSQWRTSVSSYVSHDRRATISTIAMRRRECARFLLSDLNRASDRPLAATLPSIFREAVSLKYKRVSALMSARRS